MPENENNNQQTLQSLKLSAKRTSQVLQEVSLGKHKGLRQNITIKSANNSLNGQAQKLDVLNSTEDFGFLLNITSNNESVAYFTKSPDGSVNMLLEASFVEQFKAKNPQVILPAPREDGAIFCKMHKVSFGQTGIQIQPEDQPTAEVKASALDFSILFSALGVGVVDKSKNRGSLNATAPLDMAISTQFIEEALENKNGLMLDEKEPMYSQILATYMQVKRMQYNEQTEVDQHSFLNGTLNLKSVPIFVPDKEQPEYLNLIEKDGKLCLFAHTTSEKGVKTTAKAHVVENMSIEMNTNGKYFLRFGLNSGRDFRNVRYEIDFDKNAQAQDMGLDYLTKNYSMLFTANEKAVSMQEQQDFTVYNVPNRADAEILSLSNVANLTAQEVEASKFVQPVEEIAKPTPIPTEPIKPEPLPDHPKPEPEPEQPTPTDKPFVFNPVDPTPPIYDEPFDGSAIARTEPIIPDPVPPIEEPLPKHAEPEPEKPETPPTILSEDGAEVAPPAAPAETPEEPKPEEPAKETTKEEKKKKKIPTGTWIAMGVLFTVLSCLAPFLAPFAAICIGVAIAPVVTETFGKIGEFFKKRKSTAVDKDYSRTLDKTKEKDKESTLDKSAVYTTKNDKALAKEKEALAKERARLIEEYNKTCDTIDEVRNAVIPQRKKDKIIQELTNKREDLRAKVEATYLKQDIIDQELEKSALYKTMDGKKVELHDLQQDNTEHNYAELDDLNVAKKKYEELEKWREDLNAQVSHVNEAAYNRSQSRSKLDAANKALNGATEEDLKVKRATYQESKSQQDSLDAELKKRGDEWEKSMDKLKVLKDFDADKGELLSFASSKAENLTADEIKKYQSLCKKYEISQQLHGEMAVDYIKRIPQAYQSSVKKAERDYFAAEEKAVAHAPMLEQAEKEFTELKHKLDEKAKAELDLAQKQDAYEKADYTYQKAKEHFSEPAYTLAKKEYEELKEFHTTEESPRKKAIDEKYDEIDALKADVKKANEVIDKKKEAIKAATTIHPYVDKITDKASGRILEEGFENVSVFEEFKDANPADEEIMHDYTFPPLSPEEIAKREKERAAKAVAGAGKTND